MSEAVQQAPPTTITPAPKPADNAVTPTPTPKTDNSSNEKTTSPDTITPSTTTDPNKPSDLSDIQDQSSGTINPDSSTPESPESVSQNSGETKKEGFSGTTWVAIICAVLVVALITAGIIARKKRN